LPPPSQIGTHLLGHQRPEPRVGLVEVLQELFAGGRIQGPKLLDVGHELV
jgi:hypothetical protein